MDSVKGLLLSRVFWFNVVTGILELINTFSGLLPPGTAMALNVVGNIALRFLTKEPLAAKVTSAEQ